MKRTLIQNAVIVNEGRKVLGSVVIEGEKIAEILTGEESRLLQYSYNRELSRNHSAFLRPRRFMVPAVAFATSKITVLSFG